MYVVTPLVLFAYNCTHILSGSSNSAQASTTHICSLQHLECAWGNNNRFSENK